MGDLQAGPHRALAFGKVGLDGACGGLFHEGQHGGGGIDRQQPAAHGGGGVLLGDKGFGKAFQADGKSVHVVCPHFLFRKASSPLRSGFFSGAASSVQAWGPRNFSTATWGSISSETGKVSVS